MDPYENNYLKSNGFKESDQKQKIELSQQEQNELINSYISSMILGKESGKAEKHEFWETQPVNKVETSIESTVNEPMKPKVPKNEIPTTPYSLPEGFYWDDVNLNDSIQLDELYNLLTYNYVADKDMTFRFDYSRSFLLWVMTPPGYKEDWSVGIRSYDCKELVGFISAVPVKFMIRGKLLNSAEINYLCLKTNLRGKRMAPILIQEITRRVNLKGIAQAIHTAGLLFSKPISSTNYLHRNINVKKLVQTKFYTLPGNLTLKMAEKYYQLPSEHNLKGFRPIKSKDLASATNLLIHFLSKYQLHPIFNEDKFKHYFLPKYQNVVYAYVVESEGVVTDFISFYALNSSVLSHPVHKMLNVAYLFYFANSTVPLDVLVNECLIAAKNLGFDVFNALRIMDDISKYDKLKFGKGDGILNYYIYNWKCAPLDPITEIALMVR